MKHNFNIRKIYDWLTIPALNYSHPKKPNFRFSIKPSNKKSKPLCKYCGCVSYCTSKCQNLDIPDHQEECTALSKLGSLRFFIDDKTRLIYRIWLRLKVIKSAYCSTLHDLGVQNILTLCVLRYVICFLSHFWTNLLTHLCVKTAQKKGQRSITQYLYVITYFRKKQWMMVNNILKRYLLSHLQIDISQIWWTVRQSINLIFSKRYKDLNQ